MIPKKIHYCWFGRGQKPELALKCIESWKEHCPGYELIEWNEDNFDISSNRYVKEAYEARKFAFVTDYVRLWAIYHYGGIYMDTDVMVLKPLDNYLHHQAFSGFENKTKIPTGIMASEKNCDVIQELLMFYYDISFIKEDGSYNIVTNVETITDMFTQWGFVPNGEYQEIRNMAFYPQNIFCPEHKRLNDENYMRHTVTIHYFSGSWKSEQARKRERTWWWRYIIVPLSRLSKLVEKVGGKQYQYIKEHTWDKIIRDKSE